MPTAAEFSEGVAGRNTAEKLKLKAQQALRIKMAMAKLVGNFDHSDIILESSDGRQLPAHLCILKNRAPGFYKGYIEQFDTTATENIDDQKNELPKRSAPVVRIHDVDYNSLKFFLRCIYTAEEVPSHPSMCTEAIMTTSSMSSSGYDAARDGEYDTSNNRILTTFPENSMEYDQGGLDNSDNTTLTRSGGSAKLATSVDSHGSGATYVLDEQEAKRTLEHEREHTQSNHSTPARDAKQNSVDVCCRALTASTYSSMSDSVVEPMTNRRSIAFGGSETARMAASIADSGSKDEMMTSFVELATITGTAKVSRDNGSLVSGMGKSEDREIASAFTTSIESTTSDDQNELTPRNVHLDLDSGKASTLPRSHRADIMIGKFIRVDGTSSSSEQSPPQHQQLPPAEKKIFPMFFEMDNSRPSRLSLCEADSVPLSVAAASVVRRSGSGCTIDSPGRNQMGRKRWSVTSLRSIDSADLASPLSSHSSLVAGLDEEQADVGDNGALNGACSRLGKDLVNMLLEGKDTDLTILTSAGSVKAHRCILASSCAYFKAMLNGDWLENRNGIIELKGYSENVIMCALRLIYGGVIDVPDNVSVWELISFADMIQLDDLKQVAYLHIRGKYCHFFHKPCSGCVNGVLECLPSLRSFGVQDLLHQCRQWQAKYFSRIWKTKAFNSLPEEILELCYQSVLDSMTPSNILDIMLGCEKLQLTLPRSKSAEAAGALVACLTDATFEHLAAHLDSVIDSSSFTSLGKGYALNLSLFEDVLPVVIHSVSPDTGCKSLVKLYELMTLIASQQQTAEEDWNDRFVNLLRRLYELCDTRLIHSASLVVQCDSWKLLTADMQKRIKETGIYVDIRHPKAPPPRLSSFNRMYKRSSSSADRVRDRSVSTHRFRPPPPLTEYPSRTDVFDATQTKSVPLPAAGRIKSGTLERKKIYHPSNAAPTKEPLVQPSIVATVGDEPDSTVKRGSQTALEQAAGQIGEATTVDVEMADPSVGVSVPPLAPEEDKATKDEQKPPQKDAVQPSVETKPVDRTALASSPRLPRQPQKRIPTIALKQPQQITVSKGVPAAKKVHRRAEDSSRSVSRADDSSISAAQSTASGEPSAKGHDVPDERTGLESKENLDEHDPACDTAPVEMTGGEGTGSTVREEAVAERKYQDDPAADTAGTSRTDIKDQRDGPADTETVVSQSRAEGDQSTIETSGVTHVDENAPRIQGGDKCIGERAPSASEKSRTGVKVTQAVAAPTPSPPTKKAAPVAASKPMAKVAGIPQAAAPHQPQSQHRRAPAAGQAVDRRGPRAPGQLVTRPKTGAGQSPARKTRNAGHTVAKK